MTLTRRNFTIDEIKVSENDTETGIFTGYGSVFGNEDSYGDVIAKGAFSETLSEWRKRGKLPPMLLQHAGGFFGGADDLLPVGKWLSMSENDHGLKVKGQLIAMTTERGQYIYEGMKSGVLDGLSIGFRTREYRMGTKPGEPERTLTNIDLVELSIVTFPANSEALISGVKSFTFDKVRGMEKRLREEGLSIAAAKRTVKFFREQLCDETAPLREEVPENSAERLLELLQQGTYDNLLRM